MKLRHTPLPAGVKKFLSAITATMLVIAPAPGLTAHLVTATLPDVDAYFDGIPVATQYDQFYGYSTDLMDQLQAEGHMSAAYGDFNFSTGTGGLDVLLYTGAGGQNNVDVGPVGHEMTFEDPVDNSGGSTSSFEGWWGQGDQDNDGTPDGSAPDYIHGPVTVGQVHTYLHLINPDNDIPVFYADLNQQGSGASANMQVTVNAMIIDAVTDTVVAEWSMDGSDNGLYDPYDYVDIPKTLSLTGDSTHVYDITFNRGSGQPDFVFYAPTMDLSQYNDEYLFVMEGKLNNLNDGFEEFFLTGAIATGKVPLPGLIWLLLGGLPAMGFVRRLHRG